MTKNSLALVVLLLANACTYNGYRGEHETIPCDVLCDDEAQCMSDCHAQQAAEDAANADSDAAVNEDTELSPDQDGDGLSDADELACNTNPEFADTDGDGVMDGDEDPDGDGLSNAEEIAAGSDPGHADAEPQDPSGEDNVVEDPADNPSPDCELGDENNNNTSDCADSSGEAEACGEQNLPSWEDCRADCADDADPGSCISECADCNVECVEQSCGEWDCFPVEGCAFSDRSCDGEGWCAERYGNNNIDINCSTLDHSQAHASLALMLLGLLWLPARRLRRR